MERKLCCSTVTTAALKDLPIHEILSHLLKDKYPGCVVQQRYNEITIFGVDRNVLDEAEKFVSKHIVHEQKLLCGRQREKKEDVVHHFRNKYKEKMVIYVEDGCRLNFLGQKDAVGEALCELVDINEGRKSLSLSKPMVSVRKPVVTRKIIQLDPVYFRFFKKSSHVEKLVNHEKVNITFDEQRCEILIQGEERNATRAFEYLDEIKTTFSTVENEFICFEPNLFSLYDNNNDVDECLKKFDVLLEKKITYARGNVCVTNTLRGDIRSIWLTSSGTQLAVDILSFDKLQVEQKFVMKKREPNKGGNYKAFEGGLVEIFVPDMINRQHNDEKTINSIINTTLEKVASSSIKTVAFLIRSFANWDFNTIMKCMVNSFVEWLLRPGNAEFFSVTLCVDHNVDFVNINDYFASRLWAKMKDIESRERCQPKIQIIKGHLDKADADVIVNTVDPKLDLSYGNVSRALLMAAGEGLQNECRKEYPAGINPGDIAVTSGYLLNSKMVFHVTLQRRDKSSQCSIQSIREIMSRCLKTASDYNFESIAFPAIGTGSLKYPIEEVASEMVMAVERFTKEYRKEVPIKEVQIVIYPTDTNLLKTFHKMAKRLVKPPAATVVKFIVDFTGNEKNVNDCKSWYEKRVISKQHGSEITNPACSQRSDIARCTTRQRSDITMTNTSRDRTKKLVNKVDIQPAVTPTCPVASKDNKKIECKISDSDVVVQIYCGDIISLENIDAVVCSENRTGDAKGIVARLLSKHGGKDYMQEKAFNFNKKPTFGDIITTTGGSNSYQWIIHAILPRKDPSAIPDMYLNIFKEVVEKGFASVSMPLLGTGVGDVDPRTCSKMLLDELVKFCQTEKRSKFTLHLIINDEYVADVVKNVFSTYTDKIGMSQKIGENEDEFSIGETQEGLPQVATEDDANCVICMDTLTDEKKLPCGHRFCTECIEGYFKVRMVCPTCGQVCGTVTGDQPDGNMAVTKKAFSLAGFEKNKTIVIAYTFVSGIQKTEHPNPGTPYEGIKRIAFLPDNERGRQICAMLIVSFERRLVFTIGTSRTTGKESVITWNDIHHKTDMRPNTQFGYPDDTYLQRVGEELSVKGVTLKDVDQKLIKELEDDEYSKRIRVYTEN